MFELLSVEVLLLTSSFTPAFLDTTFAFYSRTLFCGLFPPKIGRFLLLDVVFCGGR